MSPTKSMMVYESRSGGYGLATAFVDAAKAVERAMPAVTEAIKSRRENSISFSRHIAKHNESYQRLSGTEHHHSKGSDRPCWSRGFGRGPVKAESAKPKAGCRFPPSGAF
jgi:hypothetical protein